MMNQKTGLVFLFRLTLCFLCAAILSAKAYALDVNKSYAPSTILPTEISRLVIDLQNPDVVPATSATFTDVLPANVFIADTPNLSNNCGGTATPSNNATNGQIALTGGTIPAGDGVNPGTCQVEVDVTTPTKGVTINSIAIGDVTAIASGVPVSNIQESQATLTANIGNFGARSEFRHNGTRTFTLRGDADYEWVLTFFNSTGVDVSGVTIPWTGPVVNSYYVTDPAAIGGTCNATVVVTDLGNGTADYRSSQSINFSDFTIPNGVGCTVTMPVALAAYTNLGYADVSRSSRINASTATSNEGATNFQTGISTRVKHGIEVEKYFNDSLLTEVNASGTAATAELKLVFNNEEATPVALDFTDILPTSPAQMTTTAITGNSCGGTVTGGTTLSVAGGTIPGAGPLGATAGSCEITATVSVVDDGTYVNTIPAGVTGTYNYAAAPDASLIKASGVFGVEKTSQYDYTRSVDENLYTYTLSNFTDPVSGIDATNVRLRDDLDLVRSGSTNDGYIMSPVNNVTSTCGGSIVVESVPGDPFFQFSGVDVPRGTTCEVSVQVSGVPNIYYNTTSFSGNFDNIAIKTNAADPTEEGIVYDFGGTSDNLFGGIVFHSQRIGRSFFPRLFLDPDTVGPNGQTRAIYTLILSRNTNAAVDDVAFRDTLEAGAVFAADPNMTTTCSGTVNVTGGGNFIELVGGSFPGTAMTLDPGSNTSCDIEVDVIAPAATGTYTQSIFSSSSAPPVANRAYTGRKVGGFAGSEYGVAGSASDRLYVQNISLSANKSFLQPVINGGAPSRVRISVANLNSSSPDLNGLSITDDFSTTDIELYSDVNPTFVEDENGYPGACTPGTFIGNPGDQSFAMTGGEMDSGVTCYLEFNVTASVGGNHINTIGIGDITSAQNISNDTALSATLTVNRELNVGKGFIPSVMRSGDTSTLRLDFTNSNDPGVNYNGGAVTLIDEMPAGLTVQSIDSNTCGGTASIGTQNGNDTVQLSGGFFSAQNTCSVLATVSATVPGEYVNTIPAGAASTVEGATNATEVQAKLTVPLPPTVNKTISDPWMFVGGREFVSIEISNPNDVELTGVNLTDPLANMEVDADTGLYFDPDACGAATVNATPGSTNVTISDVTIAPNASCSIQFAVTSSTLGVHDNTTSGAGSDQTLVGAPSNTATLTVSTEPTMTKSFAPATIVPGGVSTMTLTFTNPTLSDITFETSPYGFIDAFPAGMEVAATPNVTTTCTGMTVNRLGFISPLGAGDTGLEALGGVIPASSSCTLSVDVTTPLAGSYNNTVTQFDTSVGTFDGDSATLTAEFSGAKDYSDSPISFSETSHIVTSGIQLGATITDETGSVANADNVSDDGITIPALNVGTTVTLSANVTGAGGYLSAWLDINGSGTFQAGEQFAIDLQDDGTGADTVAGDGIVEFSLSIPATTATGTNYARFRWSTDSGLTASSGASDGEVEDYEVTITVPLNDYSDTAGTYTTASHVIVSGTQLGATITDETSAAQDADDASDDGITLPTLFVGQTKTVTASVTGAGGYLQGWIDFNGNGTFDAGEQIATDLQDDGFGDDPTAGDGSISFDITVPGSAVTTPTYARFRWSTTAGLSDSGAANDGEVEDYVLTISTPPTPSNGTLNYANSGNGLYPGSIALFDWAGSGLDDGIRNGDSVTFDLPGCRVGRGSLTATFSNVKGSAGDYRPTDMETWSGASLHSGYNGPGTGEALYSGLGGTAAFTIDWSMTIDGASVDPDIFVFDAESTNPVNSEAVSATTNGGVWSLVDESGGSNYAVSGVGTQSFSITKTENPSHAPLLVSMDATRTDVSIATTGTGQQAVAFGVLLPCDYGDANITADNGHAYWEEPASPSGLQFTAGQLYLGATPPDSETATQSSANADGDNTDALGNDEDGITLPILTAGDSSYTIATGDITASGDGTLHAWIDFDGNGTFDADEHTSTMVAGGTPAGALTWTPDGAGSNPDFTVGGGTDTFARFRLTSDSAVNATTPASSASDGEVEDYLLSVQLDPASFACSAQVDVWYANDESGSVSSAEFTSALDFLYQVVDGFYHSAGAGAKGGLVGWASSATPVNVVIPITDTFFDTGDTGLASTGTTTDGDGQGIRENYTAKVSSTSGTNLANAANGLANLINAGNGRRTGVPQVAVFLTDAPASQINNVSGNGGGSAWEAAAANLRAAGPDGTRIALILLAEAADAYDNDATARATIDNVVGANGILIQTSSYSDVADAANLYVEQTIDSICSVASFAPDNDFGDAPVSGTSPNGSGTNNYGAASHAIVSGIYLGAGDPDAESANQPSADAGLSGADGDDGDGTNDDDGISLPTLIQTQTASITASTAGAGGYLQGWIDFDGNGTFDAGEQIATDIQDGGAGDTDGTSNGSITVNFSVPLTTTTNQTFARFRWSTTAGLDAISAADDGEVEDYALTILLATDYGDAPGYSDASHAIDTVTYMGTAPTIEMSTIISNGDASDDASDDGVRLNGTTLQDQALTTSQTASLDIVTSGTGRLHGWIDWDGDGVFGNNANELIVSEATANSGSRIINVTPPASLTPGISYARFRYSTDNAAANPDGLASGGEVEDYRVFLISGFNISGRVYNDTNVNATSDAGDTGIGGVAVVLYDTVNMTCISTQTNANGDYMFSDVAPGDYQVYEAAGETVPTPQNCNPANAADPAGYTSTVANTSAAFTLSNSDLNGINFGDIKPPVFELDNTQTILPNSAALHPHVFTAQTDGSVSFSVISETTDPSSLNWGMQLLLDANCDGQLSSANGDMALPASINVTAGQQVCILAKVVSPSNASTDAIHVIDIQSDFTYGDGTILANDIQTHQDITRVIGGTTTEPPPTPVVDPATDPVGDPDPVAGEGKLSLVKSVWNVTRNIDGNVALPGETLRYTVYYENIGNGPLNELIVQDSVPAFTEIVQGSMLCTDRPPELPACTTNENPDGSLSWNWTVNDKLNPGSSGSVSYEVMVE